MGHRANLIIVENQKYELYYDHHCANNVEQDVFWGEQRTVEFIRSHELKDYSWWLNDIWCEGGILVDLDHKVLLFFGGECILGSNIFQQKLFLELLVFNWQGYDIRWAWRGIADFADYVGYEYAKVLSPIKEIKLLGDSYQDLGINPEYCDGIISVERADGLYLYPSVHLCVSDILKYGSTLFDLLDKVTPFAQYTMPEEDGLYWYWGIHIKEDTKEIHYWYVDYLLSHAALAIQNWSNFEGWDVHWLKENYQQHFDWLGDQLIYQKPVQKEMISLIKDAVCYRSSDPVESILGAIQALENAGYDVEVNETALQTKPFKESEDIETDEEKFDRLVELYLQK